MSNLLKEAIADAKAVRATALANAKAALEEAFQPKLEAMLAEKLKNEIAEETDAVHQNEAQVPVQEAEEEEVVEITDDELNEILAELEGELEEGNPGEPVPAPAAPVAPAPVADLNLPANSSITVPPAPAPAPVAEVPPAPAPEVPPAPAVPAPAPVAEETEEDEVVDLQELLDSLNEDESLEEETLEEEETLAEGEKEEEEEKVDEKIEDEKVDEALQSQLNEALQTVQYLRDQLNEVNLLNAKLLYTNKIFNSFNLDQKQKLKVVETFDLAKSIREVKLSYTILSESYSLGASVVKKTNTTAKTITEGLASKPVASTAPAKEVIVENSNVMASRFQKLAGIKR